MHPSQQGLSGCYGRAAPRLPDVLQHDRVEQQHHEVEQVEEGEKWPHQGARQRAADLHIVTVAHLALAHVPAVSCHCLLDGVDHCAWQGHAHRQHPDAGAHPAGGAPTGEAGEEARRQQPGAPAGPGGVRVLHEGGEAAERHPGEDEDGDVDVDVKHRRDEVQHQLTQETVHHPHGAQRKVGGHERRDQRQQHVGDAEVGQAEVDGVGGGHGDAADEDPQRHDVAQQPSEGEEHVDEGQDVGGDGGGAEGERGRHRGPGCVGRHAGLHRIS